MAGDGPTQFRGIGGVYRIDTQVTTEDDYTLLANWLSATIAATLGYTRVFNGAAPEASDIGSGTRFATFDWQRADPDKYTQGPTRVRSTTHYVEVLVWLQGKTYAGIAADAALLATALDVGPTPTADGHIAGAERFSFVATRAA